MSAGSNTFTAGSVSNETFTGPGNGNTFVAGSGSDTFNGASGFGNTLDFSSVVTSSGSGLSVNLSGNTVAGVATDHAAIGSVGYAFSGITSFTGASDGYTTFVAGPSALAFNGQGPANELDFSQFATSSPLLVNLSGATVNGLATGHARLGVVTDTVGADHHLRRHGSRQYHVPGRR